MPGGAMQNTTLTELCHSPEYGLSFVNTYADGDTRTATRTVHAVRVVPDPTSGNAQLQDCAGVLVVVDRHGLCARDTTRGSAEPLLRTLVRQGVAGLAVAVEEHGPQAVPVAVRSSADRLGLPLLTSTRSVARWRELEERLNEDCLAQVDGHAEQLTALLNLLPGRIAEAGPGAMRRVVAWLAAALDAEVMVSDPQRGVLAAAPPTASDRLAPLLARQVVRPGPATNGSASASTTTSPTRLLPLDSPAPGVVLALAARHPVDEAGDDLIRHATKVLGLLDQAQLRGRLAAAERDVHLSALQLLMLGEEAAAQRVLVGLAPGLLATDKVRVYLVDCAAGSREDTARALERALVGRALLGRCPAFNHVVVVDPLDDGGEEGPESTSQVLRRQVGASPGHTLGASRPHALGDAPDAYAEATDALTTARTTPSGVAFVGERHHLVDVLPVDHARRWSGALLHPLLTEPTARREELLHTLDLGLELPHKTAGQALGIHRNTVTHRVDHCFAALHLDRGNVLDRILLSTALRIRHTHGHQPPTDPEPGAADNFAAMLAAPEVRSWAAQLLDPLSGDPRDLLRTLRTWLAHNTHVNATAAALALSPATVRNHLHAALPLIRHEPPLAWHGVPPLADGVRALSGIRPLTLALYATTGTPPLPSTAAEREPRG